MPFARRASFAAVAAGAAGPDPAGRTYNQRMLGKMISGFQFGGTAA
jgi:hypothetical protein